NTFNSPSSLYGYYQPAKRTSLTGQLSYSKLFADAHSLNVLMAFEERYEKNDNIWAQKQFVIDIDQFFAGQSENTQASSGALYENANKNFVGKFNYDYLSKYLVEAGF